MEELNLQWWTDIADILASKIVPPVFRNSSNSDDSQAGGAPPQPPLSPRSVGAPPRGCSESSSERADALVNDEASPLPDLPAHLCTNSSVRAAFTALCRPGAAGDELDLWGCGLSDCDLAAVVRAAAARGGARTVDVGRNAAGPAAAAELAHLLIPVPTQPSSPRCGSVALTVLRLNGCGLGDDGVRALARGLACNAALQVSPSSPITIVLTRLPHLPPCRYAYPKSHLNSPCLHELAILSSAPESMDHAPHEFRASRTADASAGGQLHQRRRHVGPLRQVRERSRWPRFTTAANAFAPAGRPSTAGRSRARRGETALSAAAASAARHDDGGRKERGGGGGGSGGA